MRRLLRFAAGALAILGLVTFIGTFTPTVRFWAVRMASPWDDARGDTLIVLSGSGGGDGFVGYGTYLRCEYAVRAWREGGFRRVVLSGGSPEGEPQAVAMKRFLVREGVPESAILVEPRAGSTRENALFTRDMLPGDSGKLVLLTSDYHIYRATRVFRKAGLNVFPRPLPDASKRASNWHSRWPAFLDLSMEMVKIVYYKGRGWI